MQIKAGYWADLGGEDYQQYIIPCIQNNTPGGTSMGPHPDKTEKHYPLKRYKYFAFNVWITQTNIFRDKSLVRISKFATI